MLAAYVSSAVYDPADLRCAFVYCGRLCLFPCPGFHRAYRSATTCTAGTCIAYQHILIFYNAVYERTCDAVTHPFAISCHHACHIEIRSTNCSRRYVLLQPTCWVNGVSCLDGEVTATFFETFRIGWLLCLCLSYVTNCDHHLHAPLCIPFGPRFGPHWDWISCMTTRSVSKTFRL